MHFTLVDHHLRNHCANMHRSRRIIVVVLIDGFYFVQKSELIICSGNIQSLCIEWKNAKWCGTCQKRIWRMTSRTELWRNMKMECRVMYGCASFYHNLITDNFFCFVTSLVSQKYRFRISWSVWFVSTSSSLFVI